MRKLITSVLLLTALGSAAVAQEFADQTATVQPAGPRQGTSGNNFFNIEGSANGSFASYGVARWDLSATVGALDTALGVGGWQVCRVELVLTQSNAGFTTSGPVVVYYSGDDTTDVKSAFPTSPVQYPFVDAGVPDLPVSLADPVLSYRFVEVATGTRDRYTLYSIGDTGARLALANDIQTNPADVTLTLVLEEDTTDPNGPIVAATYAGQSNASQPAPELVITAAPIGSDCAPVANAGPDQTVTDNDQNQVENITLNGSGSFATAGGATITNYTWRNGPTTIATGVSPTVAFGLGTATITLTVTDSNGRTDTDDVVITVVPGGTPPFADAGAPQEAADSDGNGAQSVSLSGVNSFDSDGTIVSYTWINVATGATLATGVNANVSLPVGINTVALEIEDNAGHVVRDWTFVKILPQTIYARHDFDGNLGASVNVNPAPGTFTSAGDAFEVKQRNVSVNIPFAVLDDSGSAGSGDPNLPECSPFVFDNEGVVACAKQDAFFAVVDLANVDNPNCDTATASFTFNIAGATSLAVAIDMGASGDFEAGDPNEVANFVCDPNNPAPTFDVYDWAYSIDGGAAQPLFTSSVDEAGSYNQVFFSGRAVNLPDPMSMNATQLTNIMQTLVATIPGGGTSLTITLTARGDGGSEGYAFDDIIVFRSAAVVCTGDVDGDNDIDLDDLLLVLGAFNTGPGGDADGDNDTDLDDLLLVLGNFNTTC